MTSSSVERPLKAIASFEALKGLAVLLLAGASWVFEGPIQREIARHLHHPSFHVSPELIVVIAIAYAALRFTEAYGLYFDRAWGQWLGIASGGLYVPFELKEIYDKPTPLKFAITVFNLIVILYLIKTRRSEMSSSHVE